MQDKKEMKWNKTNEWINAKRKRKNLHAIKQNSVFISFFGGLDASWQHKLATKTSSTSKQHEMQQKLTAEIRSSSEQHELETQVSITS